jgi:type IV secretory pathway VirB10-like protein
MSERSENLKGLMANPRTRLVVILTTVALSLGVVFAYAAFKRSAVPPQLQADVKVGGGPELNSVPGTTSNPKYAQAAATSNNDKFNSAEKTGGSSLPVPIKLDDNSKSIGDSSTNIGGPQKTAEVTPPPVPQYVPSPPVPQPVAYQQQTIALNNTPQNLGRQVDVLLERWAPTGQVMETDYTGGANANRGTGSQAYGSTPNVSLTQGQQMTSGNVMAAPQTVLVKAGTIYPAILKTGVNTDEPGPVLAQIVSGPYKGATLIGQVTTGGNSRAESVALQFNLLNPVQGDRSIQLQAYAINPDTSRTGLASDVDHHYLERYGMIFASAFLSGYGQAVAQSGSTVTTNALGGTTISNPVRTPDQISKIALGQVGTTVGQAIGQNANMPTTIRVNPGTSVGVLVMQDVLSAK